MYQTTSYRKSYKFQFTGVSLRVKMYRIKKGKHRKCLPIAGLDPTISVISGQRLKPLCCRCKYVYLLTLAQLFKTLYIYSILILIIYRTEHDIYFNLSIYIQLIVANKTYKHNMHELYYMKFEKVAM